jgi:hypothetical protein
VDSKKSYSRDRRATVSDETYVMLVPVVYKPSQRFKVWDELKEHYNTKLRRVGILDANLLKTLRACVQVRWLNGKQPLTDVTTAAIRGQNMRLLLLRKKQNFALDSCVTVW